MGIGLRRGLRRNLVYWHIMRARALDALLGFEAVALYVRQVDKESAQGILRAFAAEIGADCDVESGLWLHQARASFANLHVGPGCHLGKDVFLDLSAPILIRQGSTVSLRSTILTHFDLGQAGAAHSAYPRRAAAVEIGPRAYLGAGATVLPGIRIGEGAIVGAGALVNRDVPAMSLAVGVPAVLKPLAGAQPQVFSVRVGA